MDVLVIGGTRFLGRAVVDVALAAGHSVTTFTRGVSGEPPAGVTALHGDREKPADLEQLRGREYDVVVDTSGYVPAVVGLTAELLKDTVGHYVFVSTISAYPSWGEEPVGPEAQVYDCPPDAAEAPAGLDPAASYGYLKAGCERAVEAAFPGRCTINRSGLLVGPHDNSGRLSWWIERIAQGGRVPVPGPADRQFAVIDVRDMAAWMLHVAAHGIAGSYNVTAQPDFTTYGELFEAIKESTESDAELVWIPAEVIAASDVQPWVDLPLWLPPQDPDLPWLVDVLPAHGTGLVERPIQETVHDTWAWLRESGTAPDAKKGGMTPAQEKALLNAL